MILQGLEGVTRGVGTLHTRLAHFIDVLLTVQMHDDAVAVFQFFQVRKRTRQAVRVGGVRRQDRVAVPRR